MDIVELKNGTKLMLNFPQNIKKNGKLEYFIKGKGYKQTKVFKVLSVDLPERGASLTWFKICEIMDEFGLNIALDYAESKVAGIVAWTYLNAFYTFYQKAKRINFTDESFFERLPFDYGLALCGFYTLNPEKFDLLLCRMDKDYNPVECTYQASPCSTIEYLNIKYGSKYSDFILSL